MGNAEKKKTLQHYSNSEPVCQPSGRTALTDFTPVHDCAIRSIQPLEEKRGYPVKQPHPSLSDGSVYNSSAQLGNPAAAETSMGGRAS